MGAVLTCIQKVISTSLGYTFLSLFAITEQQIIIGLISTQKVNDCNLNFLLFLTWLQFPHSFLQPILTTVKCYLESYDLVSVNTYSNIC